MRLTTWAAVVGALAAVFVSPGEARSQSLKGYGIVLLHGKGGQPSGYVAGLATALRSEGALVITPTMPWSGTGGQPDKYDVPYEQALSRIAPAIDQLRAQGATKIVVAGQSLGANAVIGYAARHGSGLDGVVALAAGHTPERSPFRDRVADGVARAKQQVAAGRGSALAIFPDLNQGRILSVRATPEAYLSFFDPSGPAVMPRNAAAMPAIPFLWVIGRGDRLAAAGRGYAFDRAPKHPKSRYLEIEATHENTPTAARTHVIAWLVSL